MIDILGNLRRDFPEHRFEVEDVVNEVGQQHLLKIDGSVATIQWAKIDEALFLTTNIQEDLYGAVKKNVEAHLTGAK